MLIINADDFGMNCQATNRIMLCYEQGSISSTSAMVFMEDSHRAVEFARKSNIDVGLHLNFTQKLTHQIVNSKLSDYHNRIRGYLTRNKYNLLMYNPALRDQFDYVYKVQVDEFERLYGKSPSHIDGHHHMHLCANMLIDNIIPDGQKVRRNFSFARGEKSLLNRMYRAFIDKRLARRYQITDYLFSLSERIRTGRLACALELAKTSNVELETHPELEEEFEWLTGDAYVQALSGIQKGSYTQLNVSVYSGNAL